jgi:hypothetical protein
MSSVRREALGRTGFEVVNNNGSFQWIISFLGGTPEYGPGRYDTPEGAKRGAWNRYQALLQEKAARDRDDPGTATQSP